MISITTIHVGKYKYTFPKRVTALTELLEHDKQYHYNHICRCGEEQTMSSCINWFQKHDGYFPTQYTCKDCSQTEQFTFFGKTWNTFAECVDYAIKHNKFKCSECGAILEPSSYRYWIKELLKNPDKKLVCKPCDDSRKFTEYNKTEKHKADLIRNMINTYEERIQEKVQECYKANFRSRDEIRGTASRLLVLMKSDKHFKNHKVRGLRKVYASWFNLLREWNARPKISKYRTTYVYVAEDKTNPNHLKIGISFRPSSRYSKWDNYCNAKIIRKFRNRYQAAYVEYKLRTLFGNEENSEHINTKDKDEVINYVKSIHYNSEIHTELQLLGWTF